MLPQSYQYPNLSEGADRVGGQLLGDKECPFSGVAKSGRVWRKVPESDARSVEPTQAVAGPLVVVQILSIDGAHQHVVLVLPDPEVVSRGVERRVLVVGVADGDGDSR